MQNVHAQNSFKNEVYCNVCVRVPSAFTPFLVSKNSAVTAPNQGSVKPCFTLSQNSNKKCSLGEKMPCPSYVRVEKMHPLKTLTQKQKLTTNVKQ